LRVSHGRESGRCITKDLHKEEEKRREEEMKSVRVPLIICILLLSASFAQAASQTFGFYQITSNDVNNVGLIEPQLFVDVSDDSLVGQILFTIRNEGPYQSSIAGIYFDDGTLLGISQIFDSPDDVDFVHGASPGDLPSGENLNPDFEATVSFNLGAASPPPKKGVNPGEEVSILFDLIGGQDFDDVINAIFDGSLRIGMHVISIHEDQNSESFVNTPEPATLGFLALGSLVILLRKRR
jgi:hypothetical protein